MRAVVVGEGAVGIALGSGLAAAGAQVAFVVRGPERARALAKSGLVRRGVFGDLVIEPGRYEAVGSLEELCEQRGERDPPDGRDQSDEHDQSDQSDQSDKSDKSDKSDQSDREVDFLLVCVKSHASARVARDLAAVWPALCGTPRVILCQNGWGNAEIFARELPRSAIFSARVITGFRRDGPGRVTVTVHADPLRIGSLFEVDTRPVVPLCEAIAAGGIPCETSPSIERDLWAKMLYNCPLNPLGALLGVPYRELARRPACRAVMDAVIDEVFAVMAAAGLETHWKSAADYRPVFYDELLPPTGEHESSMLQDLRAGRRTEIDALSGAVADLGARHGVETPVNAALATLLRAIEGAARG